MTKTIFPEKINFEKVRKIENFEKIFKMSKKNSKFFKGNFEISFENFHFFPEKFSDFFQNRFSKILFFDMK